jgi:hypothetical protein
MGITIVICSCGNRNTVLNPVGCTSCESDYKETIVKCDACGREIRVLLPVE